MNFTNTTFNIDKTVTYIYDPILEAPYPKKILDIYGKDEFPKRVLDIYNKDEFPKRVLDIYFENKTSKTYIDNVQITYYQHSLKEIITENTYFTPIDANGEPVEGIGIQHNYTIEVEEVQSCE